MVVQLMIMVGPGLAINCGQVDSCLAPCVPYLINGGTSVTACCTGLKSIIQWFQIWTRRDLAPKRCLLNYSNLRLVASWGIESQTSAFKIFLMSNDISTLQKYFNTLKLFLVTKNILKNPYKMSSLILKLNAIFAWKKILFYFSLYKRKIQFLGTSRVRFLNFKF